MANAATVNIKVTDLTQSVASPISGINFVMGRSVRGPFADPDEIINSWPRFVEKYGGLTPDTDTPLLVKRLLEKGGAIRFSRVGHYTTPTDRETLDAQKADAIVVENSLEDPLFQLVPKYPGADVNNFVLVIGEPSNMASGYFNLTLSHNIEPSLNETYQNLKIIPGGANNYLDRVIQQSKHFDVVYEDIFGIEPADLVPENITKQFEGGDDGTVPGNQDYIGDSAARNGFHAFDAYDDSYNLAVFDNTSDDVLIYGAAYADARKDIVFFLELPYTIRDKTAMLAKRNTLNVDNEFAYIFGGGLKTKDPITGQPKEILGMADVLALENYTSRNFGPWYSFAGNNRGVITNALGVINNFGAAGNYKDLNDLANQQINMVINRDKSIKLWGNFSAQVANTQQSQLSIVRLIIFLKKSLRPTLEGFLEEPNDIPTWKRIYYTVKPFMDSMVTQRALYSYDWQGDQFADGLDSLQINDKTDVGMGKYKILLPIKAIPSLQEINVNIILTPAGIDFSTTTELI